LTGSEKSRRANRHELAALILIDKVAATQRVWRSFTKVMLPRSIVRVREDNTE